MGKGGGCASRMPTTWLRGRPPKPHSVKDGAWNSQPSSPDRGGMDSDGYSTVNEAQSTSCCRRKQQEEKCLVPAWLDMLTFKLTDLKMDVTYILWRFDVQCWLDQYQEESMIPHIYNSLRGYSGRWVWFLEGGPNLTMMDLLEYMDHAFGDMHGYDTMISSLYEIRQKEGESVKEYMLWIHEAVAVICHTYPDKVKDQGKNLAWDRFYHGLTPSL